MTEWPEHIAALMSRAADLHKQYRAAEDVVRDALEAAASVKVGEIVSYNGEEHRITDVNASWGLEKPWLKGVKKLKSGAWGRAEVRMYADWERVP